MLALLPWLLSATAEVRDCLEEDSWWGVDGPLAEDESSAVGVRPGRSSKRETLRSAGMSSAVGIMYAPAVKHSELGGKEDSSFGGNTISNTVPENPIAQACQACAQWHGKLQPRSSRLTNTACRVLQTLLP